MKLRFFRSAAAVALALATQAALTSAPAPAMGTVTIQQPTARNTYHNVEIKIIHNALFVTSADGRGTLVINRAACAYQGAVLVCFVTSATLVQAGKTTPLDFRNGTVYVEHDRSAAIAGTFDHEGAGQGHHELVHDVAWNLREHGRLDRQGGEVMRYLSVLFAVLFALQPALTSARPGGGGGGGGMRGGGGARPSGGGGARPSGGGGARPSAAAASISEAIPVARRKVATAAT